MRLGRFRRVLRAIGSSAGVVQQGTRWPLPRKRSQLLIGSYRTHKYFMRSEQFLPGDQLLLAGRPCGLSFVLVLCLSFGVFGWGRW